MSSETGKPRDRKAARGVVADADLRWVKPPRQDRSRDTQDRIVAAAERLLARGRSWAELTIAELVKEADTSVGAFYNRFRDKDALLHVLQLELCEQGAATAANAQAYGRDPQLALGVIVRAFVALAVTSYREQHGLRRALAIEIAREPQFRARASALSKLTCDGMTDVLATRYPEHDRAMLRRAIDLGHRVVYGVLDQNLVFDGAPTSLALGDDTLIEELTIAVLGYLEAKLSPTAARARPPARGARTARARAGSRRR